MNQQEYENEIKELKKRIEKLEAAKIEAEQPKRWKPKQNETYWAVSCSGVVAFVSANECSKIYDDWFYLTGNCFKTEEEAEEYKKQIEYTAQYKNYIEEHSEPLNWGDRDQWKFFAKYDLDEGKITITSAIYYLYQGVIFASSEEIIWDAIKEIGKDNFKKYVLGGKMSKCDKCEYCTYTDLNEQMCLRLEGFFVDQNKYCPFDFWKTKDGIKIAIKDMGDSHIKNCIKMLKEKTIPYWKGEYEYVESVDDNSYSANDAKSTCERAIRISEQYVKIFEEELNKRGAK